MSSSLRISLLLACTLAACSRPSTTDCPPTTNTATAQVAPAPPAEPSQDAPPPAPKVEALTVKADDGHELRLWALLPPPDPEHPPHRSILLVHGRTWSSLPDFDLRVGDDTSLSLMQTLVSNGIPAYALDLRGYGGTPRDASGWVEPDRAAEDLAAALAYIQTAQGEAPDLLGWSLGSLVAQLTVQRHPEAAHALILYGYPRDLDTRTPPDTAPTEPANEANTEPAARSDFITEGTISEAAIAAYVKASLAADPVRTDWRAMEQFDALDAELITIPTLVIHGVADPIARQLWQAKLFTRMTVPERQWVVIPQADHAAHLEQPKRFTRALLGFLDPEPSP
ncbi:Hydrolase [Enhygromyxa salina]|uniref:Hydrolase n=1 Tax=Enhygromyxa salina TaxID=215803 RepID=A0A0C2CSQ3_9BACT|nr:alpha/beta fold hydrolase [Enhygromyxa salina]KIG12670.1 Hydrolase [Enhygromyxa salina]